MKDGLHLFAVWSLTAIVALVAGLIAWWRYAVLMTSGTGWLSPLAIGIVAGVVCGVVIQDVTFWTCALFAPFFWAGEFLAIGDHFELGDTIQRFVISIAVLNFTPLVAAMAIALGGRVNLVVSHHWLSKAVRQNAVKWLSLTR